MVVPRRTPVNVDAAEVVLIALTVIAVVVWLAGLQFLARCQRTVRAALDESQAAEPAELPSGNRLTGSAEVDGQPGTLAAKAASILANGSSLTLGPIRIVEKTDAQVRFERLENEGAGRWFRRGELDFSAVGQGRTRVDWTAEVANNRWLLRVGVLFLVLALIAIVVGYWAISTVVIPSPDPGVRWQAVQMVQVVHFLWPPFVFGVRYRRSVREVAVQFQALANNLPFCKT
jgi:hypothetical protein